jgi:hypothetical protein
MVYNPSMAVCRACFHRDRDRIDAELIAAKPLRAIAAWSQLSLGGLARHKQHVAQVMKSRTPVEAAAHAGTLLARLEEVVALAKGLLSKAVREGDIGTANKCLSNLIRSLEVIGRATGELVQDGGGIHFHSTKNVTNVVTINDSDVEVACLIAEATHNYDPSEIQRLKLLAEQSTSRPQPNVPL